jgi:rhamnosyltransferase
MTASSRDGLARSDDERLSLSGSQADHGIGVSKAFGQSRPEMDSVGAVFVTYHPDADFRDRVLALAQQVSAILIVDNGSTEEELIPVRRLVGDGVAQSILNGANEGLAKALNQGLAWGEDRGLQWIVTVDQDTMPRPNLVVAGGQVYDAHHSKPVAVIGAGWVDRPEKSPDCDDPGGIEVACVITSGSLHSVAPWRALGGFREDFFVDYVDTEFCLRARASGYMVARACLLTMTHAIGKPTFRRMVFRTVTPSNHSRIRRYFITRNRIRVWRTYARREPAYVRFDIRAFVKELIKLLLFEDDRPAKLWAVARGVRDGLRAMPDSARSHRAPADG